MPRCRFCGYIFPDTPSTLAHEAERRCVPRIRRLSDDQVFKKLEVEAARMRSAGEALIAEAADLEALFSELEEAAEPVPD